MLDHKFLDWTHKLTHLGYEADIIIGMEWAEKVREIYDKGMSPEDALNNILNPS